MKTYTIKNDFHGTECSVRVAESGVLSAAQVRRVRKALCGIDECTCGGELSERGRQEVYIDVTGSAVVVLRDVSMR